VKSHETATQMTIGVTPKTPKINPNFRKSMMMSTREASAPSSRTPYLRAEPG
jgi:hypothetical protein